MSRRRARRPGQPPGGGGGGGHQEPTDDKRYLRGHQKTDAQGRARFLTVFPGWYAGRTPHIHLKVHVGGDVVHTGQVFFNERITAAVYKQAPYKSHGQPDTSHSEDSIFAQAGRKRAVLKLRSAARAGAATAARSRWAWRRPEAGRSRRGRAATSFGAGASCPAVPPSVYVALAHRLRCPLVTRDHRLHRAVAREVAIIAV